MNDSPVQYHRVLLKLSGEALMGELEYGIEPKVIQRIAAEIATARKTGVEIAIVVGGGNIFRGEGLARSGMDRVTGDHMGMIGALSAVGLRRSGHDGRFIWLKGVRELSGTATAAQLVESTGIDAVETVDGGPIPKEAEVRVDPWPRPVLLRGRAVLLAQKKRDDNAGSEWELLPKEAIRRY